jgi:hypothetical protein
MNEFSRLLVHTKTGQQIGHGGLYRLSHFKWVWEPASENDILIATKTDSVGIDRLTLWDVGGGGVDESSVMEKRRATIRRWLHRVWYDCLCASANNYLRIRGNIDDLAALNIDELAIKDCLLRARRLMWFEWNDGSRLFFVPCAMVKRFTSAYHL